MVWCMVWCGVVYGVVLCVEINIYFTFLEKNSVYKVESHTSHIVLICRLTLSARGQSSYVRI